MNCDCPVSEVHLFFRFSYYCYRFYSLFSVILSFISLSFTLSVTHSKTQKCKKKIRREVWQRTGRRSPNPICLLYIYLSVFLFGVSLSPFFSPLSQFHSRHLNEKVYYQKGGVAKNWRKGAPIRVVRGSKMYKKHPQYLPKEGFRYDGIYKVLYGHCSLNPCLYYGACI